MEEGRKKGTEGKGRKEGREEVVVCPSC